jgi:hypothetical protein
MISIKRPRLASPRAVGENVRLGCLNQCYPVQIHEHHRWRRRLWYI